MEGKIEQEAHDSLEDGARARRHLIGKVPEYWWKPQGKLLWPAKQHFVHPLYTDLQPVDVLNSLRTQCTDFKFPENVKTNKREVIELRNIRAKDPNKGVRLNLTIRESKLEGGTTIEGCLKHPCYWPAWGLTVATIPVGGTLVCFLTFLGADTWLVNVSTEEREKFNDAVEQVKQRIPPERIAAQDRAEAHAKVVGEASSRQPAHSKALYNELLASHPNFVVKYKGGIPRYNQPGGKITIVIAPYGIHFFYKKTTEFVVPWSSLTNVSVNDEKEKKPSAMRDVAQATAIGTFANRRASAAEQVAAGAFLGIFAGSENVEVTKKLSIQYKATGPQDFENEIILETSENDAIRQKILDYQWQAQAGNL